MRKKLLLTTLLVSTLFSYEIVVDKTSSAPRFERDNAKEVVIDTKTKLMWQDDASVKSVERDFSGAKRYCKNLNFTGHSDWFLPSISQLETLVDTTKYEPAIQDGFKNIISSNYWSSSPSVSLSISAWGVDFKYGYSYDGNKANEYYVRCARAGQ